MTRFSTLIQKLRRKGLLASLRIFRERFLYYHWELLTLERPLDLPPHPRASSARWPVVSIERQLLPSFERHFPHYRLAVPALLDRGLAGFVQLDADGDAAGMLWVSERDYYDDQLYRCWIRIPPGCIYQFAGEIAQHHRSKGLALMIQQDIWTLYRQRGFHSTRALVNTRNHVALKMHMRLGFSEVGEAIHVYCLFRCLHFRRYRPYHQPRLLHLRKTDVRDPGRSHRQARITEQQP